jgi:hypothetical protein
MTDTTNQSGSIVILAMVTIILSIYTLVSGRWWLKNGMKWYGWAGKNKFLLIVAFLSQYVAFAAVVVAPALLLAYLMGRMKPGTLGQYGAGIVLLTWLAPGVIYNLICQFRRNRPK